MPACHQRQRENREPGENPGRTRHCDARHESRAKSGDLPSDARRGLRGPRPARGPHHRAPNRTAHGTQKTRSPHKGSGSFRFSGEARRNRLEEGASMTRVARFIALSVSLVAVAAALAGCAAPARSPPRSPRLRGELPGHHHRRREPHRRDRSQAGAHRLARASQHRDPVRDRCGGPRRGRHELRRLPRSGADIAKVGDFAGPNLEAAAAAKPDLVVATTGVQADVITNSRSSARRSSQSIPLRSTGSTRTSPKSGKRPVRSRAPSRP